MTRVVWGSLVPAEVRGFAEPMLARVLPLAPSWCHVLKVFWEDAGREKGGAARDVVWVECLHEYREAAVTLTGAWVGEPPAAREALLRHEVLHLALDPMHDVFLRAVGLLRKKDAPVAAELKEQWRRAHEGAVCDLTAATGEAPP